LIAKERKGWERARELASVDATPHVLKHTCITWLLQNRVPFWEVAGFVGTSDKLIRDTHGHHSPERSANGILWAKLGQQKIKRPDELR
jgi:integrase